MRIRKSELVEMIKEAIASAIEEATYPEGFDVSTFKNLPSFKARIAYVRERLPKVAQGSSRAVFIVDDSTVLKVAMNAKGLAQNNVEADIGRFSENYPVAKVFEAGDNGAWLEMERAVKAKPSDLKKLTGIDFKTLDEILRYWRADMKGQTNRYMMTKPPGYDDYMENEFVNSLLTLMADYDLLTGDLARPSSWGIVNRGKPEMVLIDFGLNSQVYQDFYAPKEPKKYPW